MRLYRSKAPPPSQDVNLDNQPEGFAVFDSPYALAPRGSIRRPAVNILTDTPSTAGHIDQSTVEDGLYVSSVPTITMNMQDIYSDRKPETTFQKPQQINAINPGNIVNQDHSNVLSKNVTTREKRNENASFTNPFTSQSEFGDNRHQRPAANEPSATSPRSAGPRGSLSNPPPNPFARR